MKTKGKCQAEGKHSEKWPQALKMKEMHVKVRSEENYRVQCLGFTAFTSNLPKGKQQ